MYLSLVNILFILVGPCLVMSQSSNPGSGSGSGGGSGSGSGSGASGSGSGPRNVTCFKLDTNNVCPEWAGYSLFQTSLYKDTESFVSFVSTRFDNNTEYISSFGSAYGCDKYKGSGQRYHISIFCAMLVNAAIQNCPATSDKSSGPTNTTNALCKETCSTALSSLQDLFSNTTVCTAPGSNQTISVNRQQTIDLYSSYCNSLTANTPNCINGSTNPIDGPSCGFFNREEGVSYCKEKSSDPCCVAVNKEGGGREASKEEHKSSGLLTNPTTRVVVIIAIIVAVILLILAIIFAYVSFTRSKPENVDFGKNESMYAPNGQTQSILYHNTASVAPNTMSMAGGYANEKNMSARYTMATSVRSSAIPGLDNNFVKVVATYAPNLDDELSLNVGDTILVFDTFDDGWATGRNIATNQDGTFPLACTVPTSDVPKDVMRNLPTSIKIRASSLMIQ